jgi:hypothetical protein
MPISYKKHTLSSGKEIHVYDGLLPLSLRDSIFSFISDSVFRIGWQDGTGQGPSAHKYLYSTYSEQDTNKCGLLPFLKTTAVNELIKGLKLEKSIVNLSVPSDTHWAHSHPEKLVVLYYANMEWQQHWHGETLFYTEDLDEIELAVRYTPGRIVVFDATIPHAMRPQSPAADHYRFTYAMTFD